MSKLKTVFWLLIRKEGNPDRIDWASVFTLGLYGFLVLLVLVPMIGWMLYFEW